jgi:glycosyltransferase involved in cell wall biosynthesis
MKIYIPTRGRADDQVTLSFFPESLRKEVVLVIDSDEEHLYKDKYDCQFMVIPEDIKGIAKKRQYIHKYTDDKKIVMLDDDLRFYIRNSDNDWHLRYLEPNEYPALFGLLDVWLDDYAHVGVSAREGNNRVEKLAVENTRYMRVLGYNLDMFDGIELGRVQVMEDFDINLQLLRQGKPSKISYYYAQGQKSSNAAGGCSEWRTIDVHNQGALTLQALHPDFVKVVEKETKTAWGGQPRKDVNVQWKRAFNSSADLKQGGLF